MTLRLPCVMRSMISCAVSFELTHLRTVLVAGALVPAAFLGCGGNEASEKSAGQNGPQVRVGQGRIHTDQLRESGAQARVDPNRRP